MNHVMGMDQYNESYHNLGDQPRKELLRRLDKTKARKMYIDKKNGASVHIGYIIGDLWITLYNLTEWEQPA